jgi:hypothetical protein
MGRDFVFLKTPIEHPPTTGSLVLQIDDTEESWPVRLPAGLSAKDQKVAIAPVD